jgi:hypothetical protein
VSADLSTGYSIGILLSTFQRAPRGSLLRLRDVSKIPVQSCFLESQSRGSKQHGFLGWPLIHGWPGRYTLTRWEERQRKDWACSTPSLIGEVACLSGTVCCFISGSSAIWSTMLTPCGGTLLAAVCGCSKCCNPRVTTNAHWYVINRQINEDLGIPIFADIGALTESFDKKLMRGTPSFHQLGRHLCLPRAVRSDPRLTDEDWCSAGLSRLSLIRGQVDATSV